MGGGASRVSRRSGWIQPRPTAETLVMIDRTVTQSVRERGLYCDGDDEEYLKRPRVELEVYLEDKPDFIDWHLKSFTLKQSGAQPFDLRPYVASQLARLLGMGKLVERQLGGRFLLGLRDPHVTPIQLLSEKPDNQGRHIVVAEFDLLVNIPGDKKLHRLLACSEVAKAELSPTYALAEVAVGLFTSKQAGNPTIDILTGEGHRLLRQKRVYDLPNAPSTSQFDATLPGVLRAYYDALRRSALWRRYTEAYPEPEESDLQPRKEIKANPKPQPSPAQVEPESSTLMSRSDVTRHRESTSTFGEVTRMQAGAVGEKWAEPMEAFWSPGGPGHALFNANGPSLRVEYRGVPAEAAAGLDGYPAYPPLAWAAIGGFAPPPPAPPTTFAAPMYQMHLPNQYPA